MESDGYSSEDTETFLMKCLSCDSYFDPQHSGTCKECYEEAKETEEALRAEIEELKSQVTFMKLLPPSAHTLQFSPTAVTPADVFLVAMGDPNAPPNAGVPAHRAVLVSRSPVFKAMFENDMAESRSGTIRITDVTYDSLGAFVHYLYTAEATLDDQMAFNLLVMGEKYEVPHLKVYCEKFLIANMNPEKALENFAFARQHNAKKLHDAALAVMMDNMETVQKSEFYKELVKTDPLLVLDIYESHLFKMINTAGPGPINRFFRNMD